MFFTQNISARTKMPACQRWFPQTSGQEEHFCICQPMMYRRLDTLDFFFIFCGFYGPSRLFLSFCAESVVSSRLPGQTIKFTNLTKMYTLGQVLLKV